MVFVRHSPLTPCLALRASGARAEEVVDVRKQETLL